VRSPLSEPMQINFCRMKLANLAGHVNSLDNTLASVFQGRCGRWLLPLAKMREFEKFRKNQKVVRTCRARLARLSGPQETQNARGWEYRAREFSAVFGSDLRFAHKGKSGSASGHRSR